MNYLIFNKEKVSWKDTLKLLNNKFQYPLVFKLDKQWLVSLISRLSLSNQRSIIEEGISFIDEIGEIRFDSLKELSSLSGIKESYVSSSYFWIKNDDFYYSFESILSIESINKEYERIKFE